MKRYLSVALAALVDGCITQPPVEPTTPPVTIEPVTPPVPETPPPVDNVPPPPKMEQSIDWAASVEPFGRTNGQQQRCGNGSILLLDSVKNNTNGRLPTAKATRHCTKCCHQTKSLC